MSIVLVTLGWLFGTLLLTLAILLSMNGKFLPALPLLVVALLVLPPVRDYAQNLTGKSVPVWGRAILIVVLLVGYLAASVMPIITAKSIYATPDAEEQFMAIYDAKMGQWPTEYKDVYVETSYGTVHVIVSGPEDAPPMLLLNASEMSGWSWLYNVGELNTRYRTYAIDTLGEVGKSRLNDTFNFPMDGKALADFYVEITDALGIQKAYVVGASFGGFIATNYALHYPERVGAVALLGPMGVTPATNRTVMRIMLTAIVPVRPFQVSTTNWATGDDPYVRAETSEWFLMVMTDATPKKAPPVTFTPEQLQRMDVPVLLIIGSEDNLTGDPEGVKELAMNIPAVQIEVLESGHLIGIEHAERSNELMMDFFMDN